MKEHLTFDTTPSDEREEYLVEKIREFNRTHFELWEKNHDSQYAPAPLHIFVLDQEGTVVGGLIARTHSLRAWLEIALLWVSEEMCCQGIGRELMERAEAEAIKRGCLYARTATSYFQAPGFYEKLGYSLYGKLENCPPGDTCFYYCKNLLRNK